MNKFLSLSLLMLCGVSVLTTFGSGFAIGFGENKDLDTKWIGATRTLSVEVQKLLEAQEDDVRGKVNKLRLNPILKWMEDIIDLKQRDYDLAISYSLDSYAEQIASWIYPNFQTNAERESLIQRILTRPSSIQTIDFTMIQPNNGHDLADDFGRLKMTTPIITSSVKKEEQQTWVDCRKEFEQAEQVGDEKAAHNAMKAIFKLNDTVGDTWLMHSADTMYYLIKKFGPFDAPAPTAKETNTNGGFLKQTKMEVYPISDLEDQWKAARELFRAHYKTDHSTAQEALDKLHELAKLLEAVENWLKYSPEVLEFGMQVVPRIEQRIVQFPNNVEYTLVDYRLPYKAYFEEFLPKMADSFRKYNNSPLRDAEILNVLFPNVPKGQYPDLETATKRFSELASAGRPYAKLFNPPSLKRILNEVQKLQQDADVHKLDVFYAIQVGNLIEISRKIFPINGELSLEQIKTNLKKLISDNSQLLADYIYEKVTFSKDEMSKHIDLVYKDDMPVELCSEAYELSHQILTSAYAPSTFGIYRLFDALVENKITGGGCLEGRRNRQFTALAYMLAYCGLNY